VYESPSDFIRHNWKDILVKDKKWLWYGGIFLLGVYMGPKVAPSLAKVPVLGKVF
jgi:hypothetical protein